MKDVFDSVLLVKLNMLFLRMTFLLASAVAVTLDGSSEYAVPGNEFRMTCNIPEEAYQVQLYRRPNTTPVGYIQVGGGQCYNTIPTKPVVCTTEICSCTTTSDNYGTEFQWVIQPQTGDHGSVWYCRRVNPSLPEANKTKTSPDYTLNVADGPGNVSLNPPDTTYTMTEEDTLPDITCTADCRPGCTFVWTKPDNTNFTASAVLSLGQLDRSEHGTYRCTARNVVGELSTTITLNVLYGPLNVEVTPQTTSYNVTEGQTLPTIRCSSDCNPVCTYHWTKDGQSYTTGSDLRLTNIQSGQAGMYQCTASNSYGSKTSSDITITVNHGPGTVALTPPDTTYTMTEGVTLPDITCTADCRPSCTFVWTKPDNTNFTASAALSLGQLVRTNHGTYKCIATNDFGSSTISVLVKVQYGPGSVTLSPTNTTYTRTEKDMLPDITCTADCRPGCTFVWTKPDNTIFTASDVLSLGQLDRSERGTYRCTARNVVGELSTSTTVNILYGPGLVRLNPSTSSYTITEGQTLPTIRCSSDCNPACTFIWTKNGQSYTTGSDLQLTKIRRSQAGVYQCKASNSYGSQTSSNVPVTVNYGPGAVTLSPPDTTYTKTEGDTFPDINCTADCIPGCTFVWTKPDNTNFTTSAVLSLGQLDRSEHGTYRCTARNGVGESTTNVIITVLYGPTTPTLSPPDTSYTRTEGDTFPDITCTADCRPGCTFVWTKPDNTNFTASAVLSLGQLDRSEHGIYTCTGLNNVGASKTTTKVIIQYGPGNNLMFEPIDDNVERVENKTVPNVTCTADCRPVCMYNWSKSGEIRPNPLALLKASRDNAGTYICVAYNVISQGTKNWNLVVKFPPDIESLSYNHGYSNISENGSKTLICKVQSFPLPTITWYFKTNGTVLHTNTDVIESTYTLTPAGCLDSGMYTCSAKNEFFNTTATSDIKINVLCSPRLDPRVSTMFEMGLATSDNLTMSATFLSNPAPSSVIWTFENASNNSASELDNGTDNFVIQNLPMTNNQSALSIGIRTNINEDWFGLYHVTAVNSEGNGTLTFKAVAKGKPSPPYEGRVTCPTSDTAILSWRSSFNGGAEQTFTVGHRQSGQDNFIIDRTLKSLNDPGQHKLANITVFHLTPGEQHFFTVYAMNAFGNASFRNNVNCTTKVQELPPENSQLGTILGGAVGSLVAVIVIAVLVVGIKMKRKTGKNKRDDDTEMIPRERRSVESDFSDGMKPNILYESSDGLKANILYESADARPGPSSEYAVVQKPSKGKTGSPDAVYAVVNKTKTEQPEKENANDLYANVKKPKFKHGKGKEKEGKKQRKGKNGKKKTKDGRDNHDGEAGTIYEQVDGTDNVYANCDGGSAVAAEENVSRRKNKDGLIYLDIEFKDANPNGRNYVIHGIENKTDYVDIDFTKHADPLPPDDDDQQPSDTANN